MQANFIKISQNLMDKVHAEHASRLTPSDRIVWHYTNSVGLHGILSNDELWFIHAAYMNDSSEINWARYILSNVIINLRKTEKSTKAQSFFDALHGQIEKLLFNQPEDTNAFIACFSTARDSLSLWQCYGRGEGGFALGFCMEQLVGVKRKHPRVKDLWFFPCIYDPKDQLELAESLLKSALREFDRSNDDPEVAASTFLMQISWVGACIKHPSFKEEKEWRLILFLDEADIGDISYMPSSTLKPYWKYGKSHDTSYVLSALKHICIGPQRYPDLAKAALSRFSKACSKKEIAIETSTIPFRHL